MDTLTVLTTERLRLRRLTPDDAGFALRLLNEPSFIRYVADRGVRTLEQARAYLRDGPLASYERNGFGLWLVEEKESGAAAGICGLVKRAELEDVDIGYSLLPEFWSRGYASEAAAGVLHYARSALGLRRIVAVTSPDNHASIRLLEKLGFVYEGMTKLAGGSDVKLFASEGKESDE